MSKKTLRFLKKSRFTGQHEPLEPGTVREYDITDKPEPGKPEMHPDVLDALTRGSEPMAEELDAGEVAALRKAEAKAAAKAKAARDEEEGAPPPPSKPKPPAKKVAKPKAEEKEPEGGTSPEA